MGLESQCSPHCGPCISLTRASTVLGFDATSQDVMSGGGGADGMDSAIRKQQLSWDQISNKSAKIVSFIDLAGHEKYLKTTLFGMTGSAPDFVMLVIGSNAGLIGMCKEHLSVALALNVPVICVITKTDMSQSIDLQHTQSGID